MILHVLCQLEIGYKYTLEGKQHLDKNIFLVHILEYQISAWTNLFVLSILLIDNMSMMRSIADSIYILYGLYFWL